MAETTETRLAMLEKAQAVLETAQEALIEDVAEIKSDVKALLAALNQGKGMWVVLMTVGAVAAWLIDKVLSLIGN